MNFYDVPIKVADISYHRNGVCGEGFFVVDFVAGDFGGERFFATCFFDYVVDDAGERYQNYSMPRVAMLNPADPMTPYRGDMFATQLLDACQTWSDAR